MSADWRFIDTGVNTGSYNMQFDELLARSLLSGTGVPTVRLFQWKPWAISLGFNQDVEKIDHDRCTADNIDVVRRPTGGRAVFHAEELTYSVAMFSEGRSVLEIYNHISQALVHGLRLFGVDATLSRSQPDFREHYKNPSSIPCFTASARYEIEWHGRKLVGSAQRRFRHHETGAEVVLQHGSILIGPAHRGLMKYLLLPGEPVRESLAQELREKTVELAEIRNAEISVNELAECLQQGFQREWNVKFVQPDNLLQEFESACA
ncbi:MAG: lipoate--protein ligase family protein [Bacteroidetes bacterium]|nr:lipoate--protein ligase family protein [Bacteroidota bacterium]MCW5896544.1 lipoate--protein ligase family protein [Bacteroidota bacterium]